MNSDPLAICETFLSELGRGIPDEERVMVGYAEEATVQTDSNGKKLNAGWWPQPWKLGKYIPSRENCYACISSSVKTPNPRNGTMRYWRGESSFGHGLALMVDDIGTGVGSKGSLTLEDMRARLEPTCVVETSPGNYQLWYFLAAPEPDMRRFKAMLVGFVGKVLVEKGGDHTIRDVSRYGRMPLGVNNKRDGSGAYKYPQDFRVRLVEADYSRRYSMDEIAARFGFEIVEQVQRAVDEEDNEGLLDERKYNLQWMKMAEWLLNQAGAGEGPRGEVVMNMSGKYRIMCPWGDEHSNGDPYGAYFRGPIPGAEHEFVFGCAHDGCRQARRTWSAFVDKIVMPEIERLLEIANEEAFK